MKQFLHLLFLLNKSLILISLFIVKPVLSFYYTFLLSSLTTIILSLFSFWKVTNYGDAYWFLFSNKRVIYEALHL